LVSGSRNLNNNTFLFNPGCWSEKWRETNHFPTFSKALSPKTYSRESKLYMPN
jgi:hypothetical protein